MSCDQPNFASFIHTLGRGPSRSRALTLDEAETAMTMICDGRAEPLQIGALLALLRYRGETPAELAGMVRALRATIALPSPAPVADLDWPSYAAGKNRGLPWYVLSALLVARQGVRVLMHGYNSHQDHPVTPERALAALGVPAAASLDQASARLAEHGFAYLPLAACCPALQRLIGLRDLLGVRTAANTLARLLNPLAAPHLIQGVFHPPYRALQSEAAALLGQPRLAVFKGGGGEAERPPAKSVEVFSLSPAGATAAETWPPLRSAPALPSPALPSPAASDQGLDAAAMVSLWRGESQDDQAEAVVIGTAAIAARLLGLAATPSEADTLAAGWWRQR